MSAIVESGFLASAKRIEPADGSPADELPEIDDLTLDNIPEQFLSDDPLRPLKYEDSKGNVYTYQLKPLLKVCLPILILECLERFMFYGANGTFVNFMMNNHMSLSDASTMHSMSTFIGYVWPFASAMIADLWLGPFLTLAIFALIYFGSLILLTLAGVAGIYESWMMPLFFLGLFPAGFGGIKSLVGVMGANQFHPVLHKKALTQFYLYFYLVINIGALFGGIIGPIVFNNNQLNPWKSYIIGTVAFVIGYIIFLAFSKTYVKRAPLGSDIISVGKVACTSLKSCPPSLDKQVDQNGGKFSLGQVQDARSILSLVPFLLAGSFFFNIAYGAMADIMVVQGDMAKAAGPFTGNMMSNFDAIFVISLGLLLDNVVYPMLKRRNIELDHLQKFSIGALMGTVAMVLAIVANFAIQNNFDPNGLEVDASGNSWMRGGISIMVLLPAYFFIAAGELFCNPVTQDLAYQIAPQSMKTVAFAIQLFFMGGLPSFVIGAVEGAAASWQVDQYGCENENGLGNGENECPNPNNLPLPSYLDNIWDYPTVKYQNLLGVMAGICAVGIFAPLLMRRTYDKIMRTDSQITAEKLKQAASV